MIMLALVLAPAMEPEIKDPWSAAPRAGTPKSDLLDPFAPRHGDDAATGESAAGTSSTDLRNPFEAPNAGRSGELRNPFEATSPPPSTTRSSDLRNPFEAEPTHASDLRNPFEATRPQHATDAATSPPPTATHAGDLRDQAPRAAELVDPFAAARRVEPSARARADSLELRNPFTRPDAQHAAPAPRQQAEPPLRRRAARPR